MKKITTILMLFILAACVLHAQDGKPKVLVVTAHPDDETGACVTIYKIVKELHGIVDLALITNGEGGYKYSTLAEAYYGIPLTDEQEGRNSLPSIRKRELMNGGRILGIRNYYFFDQKDHKYTIDLKGVLENIWDTVLVKRRLANIIHQEKYDYIFCLLPVPETHAHHKCASIIALQVAAELPEAERPTMLGISMANIGDTTKKMYTALEGFTLTDVRQDAPIFTVDRNASFGFKNKLNYKIIANWVIAEHKSQGTMQLYMNMGDIEQFYFFSLNTPARAAVTQKLFDALKVAPYKAKEYKE